MIAKADLEEEQLKALLDDLKAILERQGATVTGIDVWGLRRFEYPIDYQDSGIYAVINYEAEPTVIKEFDRLTGIRDDIIRTKTLVLESK